MITEETIKSCKKLTKLAYKIANYLIKIEYIPSRFEGCVFVSNISNKNVYLLIFDEYMLKHLIVSLPIDVIVNNTWKKYFDKLIKTKK